ncbi:MAG: energy-coupling factor transporter transmembrane component T [Clostridia bacterium]|nr:energy-coupling factor transporter transmembrane component T [Clostridia bacterium]
MKNTIKFVLFLIYTISIFFIKNYIALIVVALINISLIILLKINIKKIINNLLNLLPFILFTVIINIIFGGLQFAIEIGVKLFLVCNITLIFSKILSYSQFAEVIENIMFPLKIFNINPKEIGLMIIIALSFMPIVKNDLQQIKLSLESKGIRMKKVNLLKNAKLIFKPFFVSIFQRTSEIEYSLKAKGYQA